MLGLPRANQSCPCQSGHTFSACCGPYLKETACPWSPEALMRSRYTAYTLAKIGYIKATQTGPAAENFASKSALRWAKSCVWQGLKVNAAQSTQQFWLTDTAYVEFTASFEQDGSAKQLHERSKFQRIDGRWYYYYPQKMLD